jgi:NADH-quinone oxidoreductase subunit N
MMIFPEISIFLFSVIFLGLSITKKSAHLVTCAKALSLVVLLVTLFSVGGNARLFSGAYKVDLFSQVFKLLLCFGFCLVIIMLDDREEVEEGYLAEYFMFLGFSTLGLMMLASSAELITMVISLEISSYSLYAIVPLRKGQGSRHYEAAVKYLLFGAISTGVMVYGMSYLYGFAHSTFLSQIMLAMPSLLREPIGVFALVLTLSGFFFKLSLFPLHFWAPDVYEGASNTTTTFIATVPKVAATAVIIRLSVLAFPAAPAFVSVLLVLAALSMTFGNLVGLVQRDLKRLLAYSGIAHAGYIMLGIIALNPEGIVAAIYYITVYLFMNLACFYVVMILSRTGENLTLDGLTGLAKRAPLLALTLAVSAFSLAGIPPTGGFTGKLFLFTSAFREGYLAIVIIGAVNTVISIFYYLNLVRMSYSKERTVSEPIVLSFSQKALCYILIIFILYLGLMPFGLTELFRLSLYI